MEEQDIPLKTLGLQNNYGDPGHSQDNDMHSKKHQSAKAKWKHVWLDFSQSTTIHGIDKIAGPTPFVCRRIIWLLILLGGTALFAMQMTDSIILYRSRPVTVNVKINYNTSLIFPAITICNQNAFRTTKAVQNNWYHMITELYSSANHGGVNLTKYKATNVSLTHLYLSLAHRREDMIVGCSWASHKCTYKDFVTVITDHGVCYTFNSIRDEKRLIRKASQTGSNQGLRLRLNIEQYEYMPGPNNAAGLKILVHDHDVVPLVRDLGQAIPPGSHAFAGLSATQVTNLKTPYGKCDDSRELEYHVPYSVPSCKVDELEQALVKKCGCRHVYMPEKSPGVPRACNLEEFQKCLVPVLEKARHDTKDSTCPVPCWRQLFDTTITYGTTSNYDTAKLLQSNYTQSLKANFVKAREAQQRVDSGIISRDRNDILAIEKAATSLESELRKILKALNATKNKLIKRVEDLHHRNKFHLDRGIKGVKYTIEHNFIRGWNVMAERTLNSATTGFFETANSVKHLVDTALVSNNETRRTLYWIAQTELTRKLEQARRAKVNVTRAMDAYGNGIRLLTYKASIDRRYDKAYVPHELLGHSNSSRISNYKELEKHLDNYISGINGLSEVISNVSFSGHFDKSFLETAALKFIKAAKGYNFRKFLLEERVIKHPLELLNIRHANFVKLNDTIHRYHADLLLHFHNFEIVINSALGKSWNHVKSAKKALTQYLNNPKYTKTELSAIVNSKEVSDAISALQVTFQTLKSRSRDIVDDWTRFENAYNNMWSNIITETTTKDLYNMLQADVDDMIKYPNKTEKYIRIFASMLKVTKDSIRSLDPVKFYALLNADFPKMKIDDIIHENHEFVNEARHSTNVAASLDIKDSQFVKPFLRVQSSLTEFVEGNKITTSFFRENFMALDVFFRELSYQEITQQVGYDLTNLLSDIGGSLGLFIGASVLTVFELFDVVIHNCLRIYF